MRRGIRKEKIFIQILQKFVRPTSLEGVVQRAAEVEYIFSITTNEAAALVDWR